MINSFYCNNFRNIKMESPLEFAGVNILLGPNNCGKSNFLDALSFPALIMEDGLYATLQSLGMSAIPDRFERKANVELDYVFEEPGAQQAHRYKGNLHIAPGKLDAYHLVEERLSNAVPLPGFPEPLHFFKCHANDIGYGYCSFRDLAKGHASHRFAVSEKETFFAQIDRIVEGLDGDERNRFIDDVNPIIKRINAYCVGWKNYSMSRISLSDVVAPAKVTDSDSTLRSDGRNFQNLIRILFNNDAIENIEKILLDKQIVPGLKKIKPVVSEVCVVELRIANETFKLSEMSDGTLRMLLLVLLTQSSLRPNILMIDEPEINIHPAWQKTVYELLIGTPAGVQSFLSTHSPDLLDRFTRNFLEGGVKVFVFNQGRIQDLAEKREYLDKKISQDGWELGDLYRVGDPVVGGWPW